MGKKFDQLVATCVSASPEEVRAHDDAAKTITAATAYRRIGTEALAKAFPSYTWGSGTAPGLRMRDDWAVHYSWSVFRGEPCVTVHHSRIHHFFMCGTTT